MGIKALIVSTLLIAAQVTAEPAPYKLASMSLNTAFGLLKRQSGYQPTQTFCGTGDTCAEACGAGYVQCPSSDGDMHCFDPAIQQTCCPDGSGNSCDEGYYCTSDASGGTWCCPDGMDLAACAAAYSLTGSLFSEAATSTLSVAPSSIPASISASLSLSSVPTTTLSPTPTTTSSTQAVEVSTSSSNSISRGSTTSSSSTKTAFGQFTATVNGSGATSASSSSPVQFTPAASANAKVVPGLFLLAGALFAL